MIPYVRLDKIRKDRVLMNIYFKSLRNRILIANLIVLFITSVVLNMVGNNVAKVAIESTSLDALQQMAIMEAESISKELEYEWSRLETIGKHEKISDPGVPLQEKVAVLKKYEEVGTYDFTGSDGKGMTTTGKLIDLKGIGSFEKILQGEKSITVIEESQGTGRAAVIYGVPVKHEGKVIGALSCVVDIDNLKHHIDEVDVNKDDFAYILDGAGKVVAGDTEMRAFPEIEAKMLAGEIGSDTFKYKNSKKNIGYAPVAYTNWSLAVGVDQESTYTRLQALQIRVFVPVMILLAVASVLAALQARNISRPIKDVTATLDIASQGDLTDSTYKVHRSRPDEVGAIARTMDSMFQSLGELVDDVRVSNQEIKKETNQLAKVSQETSEVGASIINATNEMATGTQQQAEELVAIQETMVTFGHRVSELYLMMQTTGEQMEHVMQMAKGSGQDMRSLQGSLESTKDAFNALEQKIVELGKRMGDINQITNVINGIGNQINLLALNAAIEAARAGESGRGFAVVAEEVRKLAEQSRTALVEIEEVIQGIQVETGQMIDITQVVAKELQNEEVAAHATIDAFANITEKVATVGEDMLRATQITYDVNEQQSVVGEKLEEASAIAEEIAASTQQIAANTEELGSSSKRINDTVQNLEAKADELNKKINRFII